MRSSEYGTRIIFWWEGGKSLDQVVINPVHSTLIISPEHERRVGEGWERALRNGSKKYDGKLWRYESTNETEDGLTINLSPVPYSSHYILRNEPLQLGEYPNPVGVNSLQETPDGFFPLGRKGSRADYEGLVSLGSGFIELDKHDSLRSVVEAECKEETSYNGHEFDFNGQVRALAFGRTHDTGVVTHLNIPIESRELDLGNDEHEELVLLPNDPRIIAEALRSGNYKGLPLTDQLMASLESYLIHTGIQV